MTKDFIRLLSNPTSENQLRLLAMYELMTDALIKIANTPQLEGDQYLLNLEPSIASSTLNQVKGLLKNGGSGRS